MSSLSFQLVPFGAVSSVNGFAVTGTVSREGHELRLFFCLSGDLALLKFPENMAEPVRCDNLWQATCFECFFKDIRTSSYYELNISPSGCWNVYHFSDYRVGMREELRVTTVSSEMFMDQFQCVLRCTLSLAGLMESLNDLQLGLSSVLEHTTGERSYWALVHPGKDADFHHPDGFSLQV